VKVSVASVKIKAASPLIFKVFTADPPTRSTLDALVEEVIVTVSRVSSEVTAVVPPVTDPSRTNVAATPPEAASPALLRETVIASLEVLYTLVAKSTANVPRALFRLTAAAAARLFTLVSDPAELPLSEIVVIPSADPVLKLTSPVVSSLSIVITSKPEMLGAIVSAVAAFAIRIESVSVPLPALTMSVVSIVAFVVEYEATKVSLPLVPVRLSGAVVR